MIEFFAIIGVGILLILGADWFGRLFSNAADRSQEEGVIRYGGGLPGNKVWKEDEPQKFESRIEVLRFSAAFLRWFMKIVGALFAIGGAAQIIGSFR